jgi:hypothetical protein
MGSDCITANADLVKTAVYVMLLLLTAACMCDSDSESLTASDGQVNL